MKKYPELAGVTLGQDVIKPRPGARFLTQFSIVRSLIDYNYGGVSAAVSTSSLWFADPLPTTTTFLMHYCRITRNRTRFSTSKRMMVNLGIGVMSLVSTSRKLSGLHVNLGRSFSVLQQGVENHEASSRIRKLAQLSQNVARIRPTDYNRVDNWVHQNQRIVIIGEAAHPFPVGRFLTTGVVFS